MHRHFLLSVPLLLSSVGAVARAQTPRPDDTVADAERRLEEGRSTLAESTLVSARTYFEACAHDDARNARCAFDAARADDYLSQVKERQHDKGGAQHAIDSGIENARRAIALDDHWADAHALLADLYGYKIGYGGMIAGMRYGPRAESETNRALQLDSSNVRAHLVFGRRYLYAPRMFGGNLDKAIDSFRKATMLDPHSDEAFVWLATALAKKGDWAGERAALDEALRLNERNVVAAEMRSAAKTGDGRGTL